MNVSEVLANTLSPSTCPFSSFKRGHPPLLARFLMAPPALGGREEDGKAGSEEANILLQMLRFVTMPNSN